MNDFLMQLLQNATGTLSVQEILLNFFVALILGLVIYLSYRFSHSSAVYSPRFNTSLLMLTIVTTLVMNVIGNNIALSLGMVGALSIVRFRTAIKDPRDTAYIFWCIAVGICCGVSEYYVPAIGSGVIFLIMLIFGTVHANDRYLLIIRASGTNGVEEEIEKAILSAYSGKAMLRVHNTTRENVEYIYELSRVILRKPLPENKSINTLLYEIEGVDLVDLVMQSEEVSR
ncbi:MAG: DUF4956 domain-containing protein [Christensenellales bacterium]|jgi:uncharacterized membrane protein YhiD involved in acid resistance